MVRPLDPLAAEFCAWRIVVSRDDAKRSVYLASPLGFAASTRAFLELMVEQLRGSGLSVHDPWSAADSVAAAAEIRAAEAMVDLTARKAALRAANRRIAAANEAAIRACSFVVAVLDGAEVESGTASEIGFAAALGRPIFGLRTDWRRGLENDGAVVNLQIEWWIEQSGGQIAHSLEALLQMLELDELHKALNVCRRLIPCINLRSHADGLTCAPWTLL